MMTIDAAVRVLRSDPRYAGLVRYAYLGPDTLEAAERFRNSAEFSEVVALLGARARGIVLDLGAGTGIASYAFARHGARQVYSLEPDPSSLVGRGAIHRIKGHLPIEVLDGVGERIPLADQQVDVVYARQVLHHIPDLSQAMCECARVLKTGGLFLACREHVVSGQQEREEFLRVHPMHQMTGSENAYRLDEYLDALQGAGFVVQSVLGPWETIINAFPTVRSQEALLERDPQIAFEGRYGKMLRIASVLPGVRAMLWQRLTRSAPGRLYAFLAQKA